jgi:carboxynorspermidine decarboxylase
MQKDKLNFDINILETPFFITDESLLVKNLEILRYVREQAGCKILLAQKAFSMFYYYPLIAKYLDGATASGLYEAKLGFEEMGIENHVFCPAYSDSEFEELLHITDHMVFNSFGQWEYFKGRALKFISETKLNVQSKKSFGLRINPECSTQSGHAIYDPCSPGSRLGIILEQFERKDLTGIEGLHFHTLCEQNADDLLTTVNAVKAKFGKFLHKMKWVNFGGGHHITRDDYDVELLIKIVKEFKLEYDVEVYLEPGEAVALNAGFLVASVRDIVENNGIKIAILDTSAACHMPDVLEMPYRPNIIGSSEVNRSKFSYKLGGPTCLAGDIIGDYSFDSELNIGDRLVFCDMAIYSMVKTNTFNGMALPKIIAVDKDKNVTVVKEFTYDDFKGRLS